MTRKAASQFRGSTLRVLHASLMAAAIAWSAQPVLTQDDTMDNTTDGTVTCEDTVCTVTGTFTEDVEFEAENTYLLSGAVFIEEPAILEIEAGTTIVGESATNGTLVIARGAEIHAHGTAAAPIVMTSDQAEGERARGDWGGLIINGYAPLNIEGGEAEGEGNTGTYGGDDPEDSSGILEYVRVEFAGSEFSPDNELNGIAFQGVGSGTTVENVMVKFNKDDGLEFFGGTVEVKYVVCYGIADDSFDWTDGWTGKGQFMIALQSGDDADQGIEADNNGDNNNLEPRSNPTIYNLTLIGDPFAMRPGEGEEMMETPESDIGMLLREGTAATIRNFIVMGFKEAAIDIDHDATFTQALEGDLALASGLIYDNCSVEGCTGEYMMDEDDMAATYTTRDIVTYSPYVFVMDPELTDPYNLEAPDFTPMEYSPAVTGYVRPVYPPNDGFFDMTDFIGAVGPASDDNEYDTWWKGWTDFSTN